MDFEAKYMAGDARLFDQKNEMFKRARWEPELREAARKVYGLIRPKSGQKAGYQHEEMALRNASWFLEMSFARGTIENNFGMYRWGDRRLAPNELPEDLKLNPKATEYNTRLVKKAARLYGADMVGICRLDRRWIYTRGYNLHTRQEYDINIPDDYQYVINIALESDYDAYKYAPAFPGAAAVGLGYSKMAFVAGLIAQFLRQLGYKAIPCGNDTAMSVPHAIQAGLGELGRNGILITPRFGPRVRLCKVFTDLPLVCDRPIEFGATEFCHVCKKCAKNCPGRAITDGPRTTEPISISNAGGTLKWYLDSRRCYEFWAKNGTDCGNCVRVCPFNKPAGIIHDITRWFIERFPQLDSAIVKADDLFGYDKQADLETYWDKD